MPKLLILDTFNFFHRAYHALPLSLTAPNGTPVNAVYGVASMLINIFNLIKPDCVVAALESIEKTERKKQFDDYKAHRKPMEEELRTQISILLEVLEAFGICTLSMSGYEGDDIVGSLVKKYSGEMEIIIASNDRDLWQLVGPGVMVMSPKNNGSSADWIGSKEVWAKYGFGPKTIVDYKALTGDASDNIPGVMGIGRVTATKLLVKYGSLEEIYACLEEIGTIFGTGVGKKLEEGRDSAFLSKELASLQMDLPLEVTHESCNFSGLNKDSVKTVLEKYAFYSLLRRLENGGENNAENKEKVSQDQLGLF
jgi:DNA polymerase-1